ncbi:MAG: LytTR family DNA-binding domain-containing protein [Sphingomonas fennica]
MAADRPLRTLLVDDEPLAIERLELLCGRRADIDVVGRAGDGETALALVAGLSPDLLLLDIAMPGLDGMAVARAVAIRQRPPAIVFCTAFDRFAVEAFDVAAVDYLLKPVAADRLDRALDRAAKAMRAADAPPPAPAAPSPFAEEFWVPHRSDMVRIAATDIDRVEAERDYMRLHVGPRSYLLHHTISELERRLDPARFIRLHRSTIVRRDRIVRLVHDGMGGWQAILADDTAVRIGRTYLSAARAIAGR